MYHRTTVVGTEHSPQPSDGCLVPGFKFLQNGRRLNGTSTVPMTRGYARCVQLDRRSVNHVSSTLHAGPKGAVVARELLVVLIVRLLLCLLV